MLSRYLPYALALASVCASAQVDVQTVRAFMPLEVGDAWEYTYREEQCEHVAYGGKCSTAEGVRTYRVVDEEVHDGDTLAVIEGPGTRALFGVRSDGSGWVSEVLEAGDGSDPPLPPFPYFNTLELMVDEGPLPWTLEVGGMEYPTEALTYFPPHYVLVRGVGLIRYQRSAQWSGGARASYLWRLSGAFVGGVSYGGFVTATQAPAEAAQMELAVGPNPTTGPLAVRAALGGPAEARVEVVDALGRSVRVADAGSGAAPDARIDMGGLPPGLYVVRLLLDGRPVASKAVTVVPAR